MRLTHFLGMALRAIRQGGQRTVVAILCIVFGVMSLVSMQIVAERLRSSILIDPRLRLGGDMQLMPGAENYVTPQHLAAFEAQQQSGEITGYMPLSIDYLLTIRTPDSGELHYVDQAMGIDPALYPLVGELTIQQPAGAAADDLLRDAGDILITRDIAANLGLQVGDTVAAAYLATGDTFDATVRGIVGQTPDGYGGRVFYDLHLAERPAGAIIFTALNPEEVTAAYVAEGWSAFPIEGYAETLQDTDEMFNLTLNGAGILGLLVAGIGIANTMQVLLARRKRDIAVLKTLGYGQRDLMVLFLIEAGVLGVSGSILGVVAGLLVSRWLVGLLARTTTYLLDWTVEPATLLVGVLVGVVTTLVFATVAIVRSSAVRPSALLRNEPVASDNYSRLKSAGLWFLLALPFTAMTSLIMESATQGAGIVLFAVAGLISLGSVFALLVRFIPRLFQSARFPLTSMALNSLRRRGLSLVFAMIALFVGTLTLTLAAVLTGSAQRELGERTVEVQGVDVTIMAQASREAELRAATGEYNSSVDYGVTVREVSVEGVDAGVIAPKLSGQTTLTNMKVVDGPPWEEGAGGVYLYDAADVAPGSEATIVMSDGSSATLPVIGSYDLDFDAPFLGAEFGPLMHVETLLRISQPQQVTFHLDVPDGDRDQIVAALGQALPHTIVLDRYAYMNRFAQNYRNVFIFGIAMAGLAILAGVLLVANAVSLALMDRRYEIGVLKAIGYRRAQLLRMLAVEYSVSGLIAAVAGVVAAVLALVVMGALNDTAGRILTMDWTTAALMPLVTIALTLATVLLAAWNPTRLAPVVILADRE